MPKTNDSESGSCIFEGYKAIGIVTNDKPFLIRYPEKVDDLRIVTCVGKYFYVYNSKLTMLEASHSHENDIIVMASDNKFIYTAASSEVFAWRNGHKKLSHVYKNHESKIQFLLPMGSQLISIDNDSVMNIVDVASEEFIAHVPFHNHFFKISSILHPSTYINKILIGSEQGQLQLFNVRKQKAIYTFNGWGSKVTCLVQSPAIDVIAIGLENGEIYLHNIKLDKTLIKFIQEWGEVLRLSFRTDGVPILASSSRLGHIALWDIEKKRLLTQMRHIHEGPVTGCEFLFQEPLLLTSSSDNKLKMWRFDQSEDKGILLHSREGHSLPPTKIQFYSQAGHQILSSSLDASLRLFSTFSERLHRNLGVSSSNRKYAKRVGSNNDPNKMTPIIDFAFETIREKEFDNAITLHANTAIVPTWNIYKNRMGSYQLLHTKLSKKYGVIATSIALTSCGNFVVIGYNTGRIDKFNIQSGLHRGEFVKKETENIKNVPITGLVTDELNVTLVSTANNFLDFWDFKSRKHLESVMFANDIEKVIINRQSALSALALKNNSIHIVDIETKKIVRKFSANTSKLNDFIFTNDCKWLIAAYQDKSIKVFDLTSAQLVDHFLVSSPCKSLSISPTNEYLATCHEDSNGIFLWANMTLYMPKLIKSLRPDHIPTLLDMPIATPEEKQEDDLEEKVSIEIELNEEERIENTMEIELHYKSPEQINEQLITLSKLPSSRWKNLLNIDLIKKRNKPKQPLEKPKNAPFFLPIAPGLTPSFNFDQNEEKEATDKKSRILNQFITFSEFGQLLFDCGADKNYAPAIEKLKELGPAAVDVEIRSLDSMLPANIGIEFKNDPILLYYFMEAIDEYLSKNQYFELINSYLGLFLKVHGDLIMSKPKYLEKLKSISGKIDQSWDRLRLTFSESMCILNYIRNAVV